MISPSRAVLVALATVAALDSSATAQTASRKAGAAVTHERIDSALRANAAAVAPLTPSERTTARERFLKEHPGAATGGPGFAPVGGAYISSVVFEGGALTCGAPITPVVTVHGGTSQKTYVLRVLEQRLKAPHPTADVWSEIDINVTVPAKADKTFDVGTSWTWGCGGQSVPRHYELYLVQPDASNKVLSMYSINWKTLTFVPGAIK